MIIPILALWGTILCGYSLYIQRQLERDSNYQAACDVSDVTSCSKPLKSKYSKLFGVSNALVGLAHYCMVALLYYVNQCQLLFVLSVASVIASVYFAYLLIYKIRSFCLICVATYCINGALLFATYIYCYGW